MKSRENWAVVGNNGAGKTTFMKLLFGELIPKHGGTVYWFGQNRLQPLETVRKYIGFVSAEYQENYRQTTNGQEVVESGFFSTIGLYRKVDHLQRRRALEWMDFLGIGDLRKKVFQQMSYGEARRLLLARALVNDPKILILDEPCAGLDIPTRERFLETLQRFTQTQIDLIYVTHHLEEIFPSITHVLYLKKGEIVNQGQKEKMLTNTALSDVLECNLTLSKNRDRYWITHCESKSS